MLSHSLLFHSLTESLLLHFLLLEPLLLHFLLFNPLSLHYVVQSSVVYHLNSPNVYFFGDDAPIGVIVVRADNMQVIHVFVD